MRHQPVVKKANFLFFFYHTSKISVQFTFERIRLHEVILTRVLQYRRDIVNDVAKVVILLNLVLLEQVIIYKRVDVSVCMCVLVCEHIHMRTHVRKCVYRNRHEGLSSKNWLEMLRSSFQAFLTETPTIKANTTTGVHFSSLSKLLSQITKVQNLKLLTGHKIAYTHHLHQYRRTHSVLTW